jgi:hypothetical protein
MNRVSHISMQTLFMRYIVAFALELLNSVGAHRSLGRSIWLQLNAIQKPLGRALVVLGFSVQGAAVAVALELSFFHLSLSV